MRILLTGGAGYVGSACLRGLLRRGHQPVAFDNLSQGNALSVPHDLLEFGDIEDKRSLISVMEKHGIGAVMHFAAVASVPESIRDPELYWRINVLGTKNVLDAMCEAGVKRIVLSSTAAVYSFDTAMPVEETGRVAPETPYGTSKLAAERLVQDYSKAYGLDYSILRYFNAAGADQDGEFGEHRTNESHLIPLVFRAALSGEPVRIFGSDWNTRDGTCIRDYIHTEDLMRAHQLVLENIESGNGAVYNVGSNQGTSVFEILACCERIVGRSIPYEVAERRHGDPGILVADSRRLREEQGWRPRHDIQEIVASAWQWHSRYPDGYAGKAENRAPAGNYS